MRIKIIGKRNCHLWAEQYCGAFPQLPAGARIYHGDVRTEWRLWRSDECICVGGLMLVLLTCGMKPVSSALPIKGRITRCVCTPRHYSV